MGIVYFCLRNGWLVEFMFVLRWCYSVMSFCLPMPSSSSTPPPELHTHFMVRFKSSRLFSVA